MPFVGVRPDERRPQGDAGGVSARTTTLGGVTSVPHPRWGTVEGWLTTRDADPPASTGRIRPIAWRRRHCAAGGAGSPTSGRRRGSTVTSPPGAAGEDQDILLGLADAEERHAAHWARLLGEEAGPVRRGSRAATAAGLPGAPVRLGVRAGPRAAGGDPLAVPHRSRRDPLDGRRRAGPRGGGTGPRRPGPGAHVRHVPRRGVRRERRPGQQPVACAGCDRRRRVDTHRPAHRVGGAALRRAVDGRRRVRLGPVATGAARRVEPRRFRRPHRAAQPRPQRERARAGLPRARAPRRRGPWAGGRGAAQRRPGPVGQADPDADTVRPTGTTSSAPGWARRCRASRSSPRERRCPCCRSWSGSKAWRR